MRSLYRLLVGACLAAAIVASASPVSASELLQDPNVKLVSLEVNGKGEALLTCRRGDGSVLAWGALNARAPSEDVPQVRFRWDYAGGWGKYRNGKCWQSFRNRCGSYDGPPLPMLVAACKAPNGTYWSVQAWQRRLPLLGDPVLPHHTNWELLSQLRPAAAGRRLPKPGDPAPGERGAVPLHRGRAGGCCR